MTNIETMHNNPEPLYRAAATAYVDVLMINEHIKSPASILHTLYQELARPVDNESIEERVGRLASAASDHQGDEELEGVVSVHGPIFDAVGLRIGVADNPLVVDAGVNDEVLIYPLVPEISDASTYSSFLSGLGARGIYETPGLFALTTDVLQTLRERTEVIEENTRIFRRLGLVSFLPTLKKNRDDLLQDFRAVMPHYYNAHLGSQPDYSALEAKIVAI